jgi:hypothetical protein
LKEIEEETEGASEIFTSSQWRDSQVYLNVNAIENVKKKFQNRG